MSVRIHVVEERDLQSRNSCRRFVSATSITPVPAVVSLALSFFKDWILNVVSDQIFNSNSLSLFLVSLCRCSVLSFDPKTSDSVMKISCLFLLFLTTYLSESVHANYRVCLDIRTKKSAVFSSSTISYQSNNFPQPELSLVVVETSIGWIPIPWSAID